MLAEEQASLSDLLKNRISIDVWSLLYWMLASSADGVAVDGRYAA